MVTQAFSVIFRVVDGENIVTYVGVWTRKPIKASLLCEAREDSAKAFCYVYRGAR